MNNEHPICKKEGCEKKRVSIGKGKYLSYCPEHSPETWKEKQREGTERHKAKKRAARTCSVEGCKNKKMEGRREYICEEHWNERQEAAREARRERRRKRDKGHERRSSKAMSKWAKTQPCWVCGWKEGRCDQHRIIPGREGGTYSPDNIVILCPNHHRLAHQFPEKMKPILIAALQKQAASDDNDYVV